MTIGLTIAVETTRDFLMTNHEVDKVLFVVANYEILRAYRQPL